MTCKCTPLLFRYPQVNNTMPSPSSNRQSYSRTGRAASICQAPARQRPKLLRASVTEPSITAFTGIQGALAAPITTPRAADVLSQVFDGAPDLKALETMDCRKQDMYTELNKLETAGGDTQAEREPCSLSGRPNLHLCSVRPVLTTLAENCYFSFPNFDVWHQVEQGEGK